MKINSFFFVVAINCVASCFRTSARLVKQVHDNNTRVENVVCLLPGVTDMRRFFCCTTLDKKKKPSSRFAARRTLFRRVISCSMTHDQRRQKSRTVADDFALRCIVCHRLGYHKIEQRSSRRESQGWFFFLSRVVLCMK